MNYNLNLNSRPFQAIKAGTKKIEGRTCTSHDIFSYDNLKPADTITFTDATTKEQMTVEVTAVRHYPNTRLMLESEGVKNVLSSGLDIEGGIESYNSFSEYRENILKYGIYAIEIKVNNNSIFLSGGGNEQQSFLLDDAFFQSLPVQSRLLYIPIALKGHELYAGAPVWLRCLVDLHNRQDVEIETWDSLANKTLTDLKSFDAIFIGGGNTWSLMKEIKDSGFSDVLTKYIETGGQVLGGSAGAIIFGKNINTHNDENAVGLKDVSGLNLLNGYSIACHFQDEQNDQFKTWAVANNLPIICLPEETGLVVKNSTVLCVGTKPCVVYSAEGIKRIISPGESI